MPKRNPPRPDGKGRKRRKYAKPAIVRHGELARTALAHSY
jgi:hypothetical protein